MYKSRPHKQAGHGFCDLEVGGGGQGIIFKVLLIEQKLEIRILQRAWRQWNLVIHTGEILLNTLSIHLRPQKYHSLDPTIQGYTNARFMATLEELKKLKKQDLKK